VEKRDEAEEAKRFFSAETAEFPGIVEGRILFWNSGIKTGSGGRLASPESCQLRRDGRLDEDKA
jgi:hypothetical protein